LQIVFKIGLNFLGVRHCSSKDLISGEY